MRADFVQSYQKVTGFFLEQGYSIAGAHPPTHAYLRSTGVVPFKNSVELRLAQHSSVEISVMVNYQGSMWEDPSYIKSKAEQEMAIIKEFINSNGQKSAPITQPTPPSQPIPNNVTHRETIIERQVVVKVRCRYCGTLNNDGNPKCESCGANL